MSESRAQGPGGPTILPNKVTGVKVSVNSPAPRRYKEMSQQTVIAVTFPIISHETRAWSFFAHAVNHTQFFLFSFFVQDGTRWTFTRS